MEKKSQPSSEPAIHDASVPLPGAETSTPVTKAPAPEFLTRNLIADVQEHARKLAEKEGIDSVEAEKKALAEYVDLVRTKSKEMTERYQQETTDLLDQLFIRLDELASAPDARNLLSSEQADMNTLNREAEQARKELVGSVEASSGSAEAPHATEVTVEYDPLEDDLQAYQDAKRFVNDFFAQREFLKNTPEEFVFMVLDELQTLGKGTIVGKERDFSSRAAEKTDLVYASLKERWLAQLEERQIDETDPDRIAEIIQARERIQTGNTWQTHEFLSANALLLQEHRARSEEVADDASKKRQEETVKGLENELWTEIAAIGQELHRYQRDVFLRLPLSEIRRQLQSGERHPRVYIAADVWHESPDKVAEIGMDATVTRIHRECASGFQDYPNELSPKFIDLARQVSHQLENGFFEEAVAGLDKLTGMLPIEEALSTKLWEYREAVSERVGDRVGESSRISEVVYKEIENSPLYSAEEKKRLRSRHKRETALRTGVMTITGVPKTVSGSSPSAEEAAMLSPETISADSKVTFVKVVSEDGETVGAAVKSTLSDSFFRYEIPPNVTDVNEWLAGLEAVCLGADEFVPATVLREREEEAAIGTLSVQELVYRRNPDGSVKKNAKGNDILAKAMPLLRNPDGSVQSTWHSRISQENKELLAVMQLLQNAQDAGWPNYLITEKPDGGFSLHSIDNGLTNPLVPREKRLMSVVCAERGAKRNDEPISAAVLAKIERYERMLPFMERALKRMLPYDVTPLINHRRAVVRRLLTEKKFPGYVGEYKLRDYDLTKKLFETANIEAVKHP